MDDFPDSSTQRDTVAAGRVPGTPESARPAVRAASGPCLLPDSEYASERTLRFPPGAQEASRAAAPPSPRSGRDNANRLAAGKPQRRPYPRSNRPPASRCRSWLWNAACILSLAVALVCLALIPPNGGKSAVDPDENWHTAAFSRPTLPTIPIERIRPGDWALAHNPELTDEQRWAAEHDEFGPVEAHDDWRLVSLRMDKPDGSDLQIELLRPVDWLDWYEVRVGAEIDLDLEELGADGPATVLAIHRCPQILPRPGPGYQLVTGRFAHSSAEVLDLVLIDAHGQTSAIGVTASHPFWSADQQAFVPAGHLTPGTRLQTATGDPIQVATITPRPGREAVFNIEVDVEHVYHVGTAGVLVHNMCHKRGNASNKPVKKGIYEFPDQKAGGTPYVGQSGNVPNRLARHKAAGRLKAGTESTTQIPGATTAREIAEHKRIQRLTGGKKAKNSPNVSNKRDPIGPARRPDLGLPEPSD